MKKQIQGFLLLAGMGSMVCFASEMPARYNPPFMEKLDAVMNTKALYGKNSARFTGESITMVFHGNVNEICLGKEQIRIGGTNLLIDGKTGVRGRATFVSGSPVVYPFAGYPDVKESYSVNKNGSINCEIATGGKKTQISIAFIRDFFGGSAVVIDGKRFQVPPVREGESFSQEWWNAPAKRITFFPDSPEKRFDLLPGDGVTLRFSYISDRYGLHIRLIPKADASSYSYTIEPGRSRGDVSVSPAGYNTQSANYDFWKDDRLRLPDNRAKNLLNNSSFEQGMLSFFFHHTTSGGVFSRNLWEVKPYQISGEQSFHGTSSLRIQSDQRERNISSAIATHPVMLTPGDYVFSLYAKTSRPGVQTLSITQVDLPPGSSPWNKKTWEVHHFQPDSGWKRFSFPVRIKTAMPQFFVISASSPEEAFCYVDALQLEKGKAATAYEPPCAEGRLVTSDPGNFLEFGKKADAFLEVTAAPDSEGIVKTTVKDFFGTVKLSKEYSFRTDSTGKAKVMLPLDGFPRGIFVMENDYRLKNGAQRYEFLRFSVMNFLENKHKNKNLFANAYIDPYGNLQIFPEVLERYKKIGIGSRAGVADNEALTNLEGLKYGVDPVSGWVTRARRGKNKTGKNPEVTLYIPDNIVGYAVPAKNMRITDLAEITLPCHDPARLKAFSDGAAKLSASAPWIQAWSNLGEAEGVIPDFANAAYATDENFRNYVDFEVATAQGLRRGNPKAMIGTSATSCLRKDRIDSLDKFLNTVGNRFHYDCFFIHTYREAPEYPNLDSDFQDLFKMLARHGYTKESVICSEGMHWKPYHVEKLIPVDWVGTPWGPFSYDMGHQERLASAWRARHWLVGLKLQDRIKVMNSSTNFWGFEMDPALTPFATQKISNTLGRLLGNSRFAEEIKLSAKSRCYIFEDEMKRPVAALWSCDPDVDKGYKAAPELLVKELAPCSIFDLMENEFDWKGGKNFRLELSPYPVFLRGQSGTLASFSAELKNSELNILTEPAATSAFRVISPSEGVFTLGNDRKSIFKAEMNVMGKILPLELASGEKKEIHVQLPSELRAEKISFEDFSIPIRQILPFAGNFTLRETFSGLLAKKVKSPIRLDGSLDDWQGIPAIPIQDRMLGPSFSASGKTPSDADFSAEMRIAWDDTKLYVAVQVRDDKFVVHPRPLREGWKNDSLQIYFDTFCDARSKNIKGLDENDYSFGFYFENGSSAPKAYLHHVPDMQLTRGVQAAKIDTVSSNVETAWKRTPDGYIYEIAFSYLGIQPLKLAPGEVFGMGMFLNDQDGDRPMPASHLIFGSRQNPNGRPDTWPIIFLAE